MRYALTVISESEMKTEIEKKGTLRVNDIGGSYYISFFPDPFDDDNRYQFGKFASAPEDIIKEFSE